MRIIWLAALFSVISGYCLAQSPSGGQVLESALKAREELKKFDVGFKTQKTVVSIRNKLGKRVRANRYFVSEKEFVFAILTRSGETRFLRAYLRRRNTGAFVSQMEDRRCSVVKAGGAGVSERFTIDCGEGEELVLATLRAVVPSGLAGSEDAIKNVFEKVIYSAYYDNLVFPEVVASGRNYIEIPVAEAKDELTRLGVMSRAFPDMLIAEVFSDSKHLVHLSVIEHNDHDEFEANGPIYMGNKVFVQLAINREETFKYSISTVRDRRGRPREGALCLMQIWPPTYRDVRGDYPRAKLPESPREGSCMSHKSAMMVAYIVLDSKLALMPQDFKDKFREDPDTYFIYLAAAYNGGEGRARPLYRAISPERLDEILKDFYSSFRPGRGDFRVMRGRETWIFIKKYMEISKNFSGLNEEQEETETQTEDRPQ